MLVRAILGRSLIPLFVGKFVPLEFGAKEDEIVLSLRAIEIKANVNEEMYGECISVEEPFVLQQPMASSDVPNSKYVVNYPTFFSLATLPFKPSVSV